VKCLFQKLIVVGVLLALLSGCATTGAAPDSGSTSDDANYTKAQGTALGAGVGAVLGAVLGNVVGGRNGMLVGAGVGALLGGAGGYALGSSVASRKQQYVNEEDRLDGEIQAFAKYNSDLEEFNKQTATQIQTLDQQIAELKAQSSTSQARAHALQSKQNEIKKWISEADQRKRSMNKELAALDQDLQRMNTSQDQAKVEKLNQEVNALKENIAVLDAQSVEMAKLNESTMLGK
jgi:flagellar biosynthesis GTPase FlhF